MYSRSWELILKARKHACTASVPFSNQPLKAPDTSLTLVSNADSTDSAREGLLSPCSGWGDAEISHSSVCRCPSPWLGCPKTVVQDWGSSQPSSLGLHTHGEHRTHKLGGSDLYQLQGSKVLGPQNGNSKLARDFGQCQNSALSKIMVNSCSLISHSSVVSSG